MLIIYIDADACPVKDEIYRVARRYAMRVAVVANAPLRVPADALVELVVRPGFGAADDWIAEQAGTGDVFTIADPNLQLDQLEERGLVRRSPHPADRRAIYVTLTRSGERLVDKAIDVYNTGHKRMLTALSSSDRQALDALLRKLLIAVEASNGAKPSRD